MSKTIGCAGHSAIVRCSVSRALQGSIGFPAAGFGRGGEWAQFERMAAVRAGKSGNWQVPSVCKLR